MVKYAATIRRFDKQGEKTGWTYIDVPQSVSEKLKPGTKKTYRVRGKLDEFPVKGMALVPMGGGDFILALNAQIRKGLHKPVGAKIVVTLEADDDFDLQPPAEFGECLKDEKTASDFFYSLPKSHQHYFINWLNSAKTDETRVKRIAEAISALEKKMGFGEMIRASKKERRELRG